MSSFEEIEAPAKTRLGRLARQTVDGKAPYEVRVTTGNPDVEIPQAAKRLRANLIVMGTHLWKGIRRLLLGRVSLNDSLMSRWDRLGAAKEVAQLGVVLGRKFSYELLQAVSSIGKRT